LDYIKLRNKTQTEREIDRKNKVIYGLSTLKQKSAYK